MINQEVMSSPYEDAKRRVVYSAISPEQMLLEQRILHIDDLRAHMRNMLTGALSNLPNYQKTLDTIRYELAAWYFLGGMRLPNEEWIKIFTK
jgi:hypothetical protein